MLKSCVKTVQISCINSVEVWLFCHSLFSASYSSVKNHSFYPFFTRFLPKFFPDFSSFSTQLIVINTQFPQGLLK